LRDAITTDGGDIQKQKMGSRGGAEILCSRRMPFAFPSEPRCASGRDEDARAAREISAPPREQIIFFADVSRERP
jgi:hypothetical protein